MALISSTGRSSPEEMRAEEKFLPRRKDGISGNRSPHTTISTWSLAFFFEAAVETYSSRVETTHLSIPLERA